MDVEFLSFGLCVCVGVIKPPNAFEHKFNGTNTRNAYESSGTQTKKALK